MHLLKKIKEYWDEAEYYAESFSFHSIVFPVRLLNI